MSARRVPSAPAVLLLVAGFDLSLRVLGLRRTIAIARRVARHAGRRPDAEAERELVDATALRVARAAAFHVGRAQCLEQSLALWLLLRRRGVPAELRLGVQTRPFMAHAWVEHDGRPVNERGEYVEGLLPFPAIGG